MFAKRKVLMDKRIVIIDGNSLINRAYYAMQRPMITREGIYTQGIYGFINMLQKIRTDYEPEYLTVAFDLKGPTFRHLEYEDYKAGRKAMPMELVMQMPIMKDVLRAMNISILELEGYEADDIIGTVAKAAEENGIEPLIITGDRDALQLVTDKTKVLITKKGITDFELYDPEKMKERYELTASQFIDLKGLMGDSSDNIPGIPGVGEKTGIKLLRQFGSVEELLANTMEISSEKLRSKIEENAQLAVMSKRLATINVNVPIELELESFRLGEPDYEALIDIYKKLEFNSFLKKLKVPEKSQADDFKELEVKKEILDREGDLEKYLSLLQGEVYLKVFGNNGHTKTPYIEGVLLMDDSHALFTDTAKIDASRIAELINGLDISLIGHEIKDDIYSLMCFGLKNFNIAFDTAVAEYVLEPAKSSYSLKNIALENLHADIDVDRYVNEGSQMDFFEDSRKKMMELGVKQGSAVKAVKEIQSRRLEEQDLLKVYNNAELPLIEVMASMEAEGIKVNGAFLEELGKDLKSRISELEKEIYEQAGCEFNINSPQQLGNILFETLELPMGKKTKRGYSTSADVLEKIRDKHPIVDTVLTYRNLSKLSSTYVEGMKPLICEDGKIRAHFQQTVTATGRISCTEPNLQNIPIRQELGRTLRKAFTADDREHILIGADYSQIELRVLAHLSGDDDLIKAFNDGEDIHRATAARVLGVPFDKVSPEERSRAKAVNFGVIYGMSGFGLSEELNISRKEAEKYIDEYFIKHKKVKEYMDGQISMCREKGYSETILGRKRPIHEINATSYMIRQLGERLAMNSPIQGSAADIIKLAMIKVYNELKKEFPDTKLILQVHDELILCAPQKDKDGVKELLRKSMETAVSLSVKLVADVNEGYSWYDLK